MSGATNRVRHRRFSAKGTTLISMGLAGMLVATGSVLIWTASASAETNRLPGVIDRRLPELPKFKQEELPPPPTPTIIEPKDPNASIPTLTSIDFTGNTIIDNATLQGIAAPYLNRALTQADIAQLKFDLTKVYYDEGYVLARVVTPPQDLSDGQLDVVVYEAHLGAVTFDGMGALSDYVGGAMTQRLSTGDVFREQDIESTVRDIDDLPGVDARINISPGAEVSTTDVTVTTEPVNDFTQRLSVDNYGAKLTGEWVGQAQLQWGNLLGLGELYFANVAYTSEDALTVDGGIITPIGVHNLLFDISALYSQNDISIPGNPTGETRRIRSGVSSNIINTGREKITVRAGFEAREHKSTNNGLPETEDDVRQLTLDVSWLRRYADALFYGGVQLVKGLDVLGASTFGAPAGPSRGGVGGDPAGVVDPIIVRPFAYLQMRPWEGGQVEMYAAGQWTPDTVLPSDTFVIGGYGSVRGFEPAQEAGDDGVQFTVEYQHEVYRDGMFTFLAGPFFDLGHVWSDITGGVTDPTLTSVGIGAEVNVDIAGFGVSTFRIDWAHPIGSYTGAVSDDTVYGRFVQEF